MPRFYNWKDRDHEQYGELIYALLKKVIFISLFTSIRKHFNRKFEIARKRLRYGLVFPRVFLITVYNNWVRALVRIKDTASP